MKVKNNGKMCDKFLNFCNFYNIPMKIYRKTSKSLTS